MIKTSSIIESLESRKLLSAAFVSHGALIVHGDANAANTIDVHHADDGSVSVTVHSLNRRGVTRDFSASFPTTVAFSSIRVTGGIGNDTINVGQTGAAFTVPVIVHAFAGDDLINTSEGDDRVFAGAGNDTVNTGLGNDRVHGFAGNDIINTGAGDDFIRGGADDDTIDAGDDNDIVHGQKGNDIIHGGNGNDTLWGGQGDDEIYGEAGNDKLGGILGANKLIGGTGQDTFVVKDIAANPTNDYNDTEDILTIMPSKKSDSDNSISV